jgi:hypothetical protein
MPYYPSMNTLESRLTAARAGYLDKMENGLVVGQPVAIHSFDVNTSFSSSSGFADSTVQFNVPNVTGKTYAVEISSMYWSINNASNYVVWQWEGDTLGNETAQHGWWRGNDENGYYYPVAAYSRGGFSPNEQATIQGVVGVNTQVVSLRSPVVVKVFEET